MKSLNRVTLLGRLGKDAEQSFTQSGTAKAVFSLATDRSWKDKGSGEWKTETDWHNVVLWRSENLANYLLKGAQVYVEGRMQTRKYEQAGTVKYITEIVAENVILCGVRGEKQVSEPAGSPAAGWSATDDDVPF